MNTAETFYFVFGILCGLFSKQVLRYALAVACWVEERREFRRREKINEQRRSMNYIRAGLKRPL